MGIAARLFGRESTVDPIQWRTVPADRTHEHPGLVESLLDRTPDGITITGVFSRDEVDAALARFSETVGERLSFSNGSLLGRPLGYVGEEDDYRGAYLDDTDRCRKIYPDTFGFDPHERLAEVLAPMTARSSLVPPTERGREYNPGHVRYWEPEMGGLRAHIGNEFAEAQQDDGFVRLFETTVIIDHLSYFAVLQKPELGGSLSVFELTQEEHTHAEPWGLGERDDSYFSAIPHLTVDAEPGDVVLFGGGWRWHRVEPILGSRPRITYGGFCSPARDADALNFWC